MIEVPELLVWCAVVTFPRCHSWMWVPFFPLLWMSWQWLVLEDGVFLGRRCTDAAQISTCVKSSANPGSEVVPHCGGRGDH